jgi:hypothetical protein
VAKDVEINADRVRKGPSQLPVRNITDFNQSLRCMDGLFLSFGIARGDYVLLVEDLKDKTKKVDAGTRQMVISAISDMTKRSGALRLIAYGADSGNLISFLNESGKRGAYQNIPAFDIIGSISQFDDGIYKAQADASGEFAGSNDGSIIGAGGGRSSSNSVTFMSVDLSVVTSHNLAILPGVNTRNTVALFNKGSASSYDAGISKTGVSYSFSKDSKDSVGQGLRGLIELSTIELVGKLVKIPYWKCLGMDPSHPDIANEVSDWFYQLASTNILHKTLKIQLYLRGLYNGPIDEAITPEYLQGILQLKQALNLPLDNNIDLNFYASFLNQTPITVSASKLAFVQKELERDGQVDESLKMSVVDQEALKQAKAEKLQVSASVEESNEVSEKVVESAVIAQPTIGVAIVSDKPVQNLAPGEEIKIGIRTDTDGFVNGYFQQGRAIAKIFPNRFSGNGALASTDTIVLPNDQAFSFLVGDTAESIHCYVTELMVDDALPESLKLGDFSPITVDTPDVLTQAYSQASNGRFGYAQFQLSNQSSAEAQ